MKLNGELKKIADLSEKDIERMFLLMSHYYDNMKKDKFLADLKEKDGVMFMSDEDQVVQGFSTYCILNTVFHDRTYYAVFSGDTIVDCRYWGQQTLYRCFAQLITQLMESGNQPLYWFLMSKGVRTYLMLPLFFKSFFPHPSHRKPTPYKPLVEQLADERFGAYFHRDAGIVRMDPPADRLKPEIAVIPQTKSKNPHIGYFLERNPGYDKGDELVCITSLNPDNFTRAGLRFMEPR